MPTGRKGGLLIKPDLKLIEIGKIIPHPLLISNAEQLAKIIYLLKSFELLSSDACHFLAHQHPILVLYDKEGVCCCVGGLRTYQLISRSLPSDEKIPVNCLNPKDIPKIEEIVYADLFLTSLCYTTNMPIKVVHEMSNWLPSGCLKRLVPGIAKSKAAFAKALHACKASFYYRPR